MKAIVQSSITLSPAQLKALALKLGKLVEEPVDIENQVDSKLIAGLRILIGSRSIDLTVASSLDQLKQSLLSQ